MSDGTVYAGVSPDTGLGFYAAVEDAPEKLDWHEAQEYARESKAYGQNDWRLPTAGELNVMFNNRAAIGNFNADSGFYWSSSEVSSNFARSQRFSDGNQNTLNKDIGISVRCVRG